MFYDLKQFAESCRQSNISVFHHLILEAHLLVQQKVQSMAAANQQHGQPSLLSPQAHSSSSRRSGTTRHSNNDGNRDEDDDDDDDYEANERRQQQTPEDELASYFELLLLSSRMLGDYYLESNHHIRGALFYARSDLPLSAATAKLAACASSNSHAQRACTIYFEKVLFGRDPEEAANFGPPVLIDDDAPTAHWILQHIASFAPQKLAAYVLKSRLSAYETVFALELFNTMANNSAGTFAVVAPENAFARAVLLLDCGRTDQAAQDLLSLDPDILVSIASSHMRLFTDNVTFGDSHHKNGSIKTALRDVFVREAPVAFVDAMVHGARRNDVRLSWSKVFDVLLPTGRSDDPAFRLLVEAYLESQLFDRPHGDDDLDNADGLVLALAELYLEGLATAGGAYPPVSQQLAAQLDAHPYVLQLFSQHKIITLTRPRPDWLNDLPPFNGRLRSDVVHNADELEALASAHFYVVKLQRLCSQLDLVAPVAVELLARIDTYNQASALSGFESLTALLAPLNPDRREEAFTLMVDNHPQHLLEYASPLCSEPEHWRFLLSVLFARVSGEAPEPLLDAYRTLLRYVSRQYSPAALLSLVPDDGDLFFFVPYLEEAFRQSEAAHSKQLLQNYISVA